jgi:hypothetical protein
VFETEARYSARQQQLATQIQAKVKAYFGRKKFVIMRNSGVSVGSYCCFGSPA